MASSRPRVSELLQGTFLCDPETGLELEPFDIIGGECGLDHLSIYMRGKKSLWRYRIYVDEVCPISEVGALREALEALQVPRPEPELTVPKPKMHRKATS